MSEFSPELIVSDNLPLVEDFFPHYQPFIHVSSGSIIGYEALARSLNSDGKVVSAGGFFSDPQISRSDKLTIDRYLRRIALEKAAEEPDQGFFSINISPDWVDLLDPTVSGLTIEMVEKAQLDPSRVLIEITESGGNLENLRRQVKNYHAAGLKVAIDDFGTGASHVDRIIALEPEIIKLDMGLFKQACQGGLAADVVLSTTSIAQRAGCEIVCEGVETEDEFHFAVECGADYIQGWLFSPAVESLYEPAHFLDQVRGLQSSYLKRKSDHLTGTFNNNAELKNAIHLLSEQVAKETTQSISFGRLSELGVLRFYLCDAFGNQTSDNFNFTPSGIVREKLSQSHNWSHRPYFSTLRALALRKPGRLVLSPTYRDSSTRQLCKTFGRFLNGSQILLVDAAVNDETLFL